MTITEYADQVGDFNKSLLGRGLSPETARMLTIGFGGRLMALLDVIQNVEVVQSIEKEEDYGKV